MKTVRLVPFVADYIWGGRKLIEEFHVETLKERAAEAWVLSMHQDGESITADGVRLSEAAGKSERGVACSRFDFFPVLVKLIDAKDNLSVQVHPSDDYALVHENSYGKTEMWYVLDAQKGAGLYVGLKKDTSKAALEKSLQNGTVLELLNFFEVKKGDCFFIPSGTIHAIGAGCTICEVQQNSNLTYRLYDYNRKGADGNPRPLHIEKALKVSDLSAYVKTQNSSGGILADCEYFTAELIKGTQTIFNTDSFTNLVVLKNGGVVDGKPIKAGDSYFVPAGVKCEVKGEMMKVYVKNL